jgi:hypothetical protein
MALNFPANPSTDDTYTENSLSWVFNGSSWVSQQTLSDALITLGSNTDGDYVQSLVAGTGVTLSNNSGEGATPTIAIGQAVGTSDSVTFAGLTINGGGFFIAEGATVDDYELFLTSEDPTADRTIVFPDASGTVALIGQITLGTDTAGNYLYDISAGTGISVSHTPGEGSTASISINANLDDLLDVSVASPSSGDFLKWNGSAWVGDAIDLGTDTTGNYVSDVSGGTGVTVTHTPGEGSTPSIAIGQAVGTTDNVTFNDVTVNGDLTVNGTTTTLNTATLSVEDNIVTLNSNVTGSPSADAGLEIERGTSTNVFIRWNETSDVWEFTNDGSSYYSLPTGLGDISDISISSATDGDYLRWNGTSWVNDVINLGTDTSGDYVQNLTAGTGITLSNNSGEGATPTIAIGQAVGTTDNVTFSSVTGNLIGDVKATDGTTVLDSGTDGTDATFTGDVTGNASTASALATSRTIELTGDITGSASFDGSANIQISTTVGADSIALGTDTTGDYVESISGGTGVTITAGTGEGSTPSVAIGQAVGTTDDVTFNSVTGNLIGDVYASNGTSKVLESGTDGTDATFTGDVTGDLTGNASTASALQTSRTIELTGDVTGSVSFDGSANVQISTTVSADSTTLGTDTTGDYVESISSGTGVTITGGTGEGSTPSIAIGQAVGTTDNVTFSSVSGNLVGDVYASDGTSKVLESGTNGTDATFTGDVTGDLTGNADTASALATGRTIELTGDVTGSVSFDGSANVQISTTIGADSVALGTDTTGSYVESLVAGTGVTLANNSGESATPTVSIGQAVGTSDSVTFANVTVSNSPTQASHAATKSYVDSAIAGIDWHQAVKLATATSLPNSPSYSNGTSGVGATLTATAYARLQVDGANATTGDRVLVKNQSTSAHNGIYLVTEQGNAVDTYWVLTRATDFDSSPTSEIKTGEAVFVTAGATNIRQGYVLTTVGSGTDGAHVLNTDDLTFTQFTGTQAFTAGTGLAQSGNTLNVGTASSARIVVNADDIDLAAVSQTNTSGSSTTTFVSGITVDSYGRVSGRETSAIDFSDTALTGTPTAPTASTGTSTTQIATTAFVDAEIGDQAVLKSVVDAKGDIIVASGADAVARLAVGTDGYFLKADSGATNGVEWASIPTINNLDDIGDVVITSAANGQLLEFDGTNWVNAVRPSGEPIGHEDKTGSTMSFNESTRTFSIAPVSGSHIVWCKGKRFVKTTTETTTIPDTSGLYYIYYNNAGTLTNGTSFYDWENDTPTAYIYWNATDDKAYFFADERHGITLDWATHEYLHRTRGAAIANGFGANNYTITGDGSLDADATIDIANGTFFDEDLQVDITHSASPTANTWEQRLQSGAYIPIFYRLNSHWKQDTATQFPMKQGTARVQYNLNTAGTWSTADHATNQFGITWIIATNNLGNPVIGILGQDTYATIGQAEAVSWEDMELGDFPIFEFRPLYKIVYQTSTGYSNTPHAKLVSVVDKRVSIPLGGVPATPVSDHGSMTGLSDDDHTQYLNTARHDSHDHSTAMSTVVLDDVSDVSASSPTSGDFLKWNGSAWVNDAIDLGTDTTGNYVVDVSAGTGISVSHTPSEGSTATVSLNANLDDVSDVTITSATSGDFLKWNGSAWVNDPIDLGTDTTGNYMSDVSSGTGISVSHTPGEGSTATVSLSANLDDVSDVTITSATSGDFLKWNGTAWVNDAIDLGTDTTGNYMLDVSAGTGISITHTPSEGSTATVALNANLDDISDVSASSPTSGDFLKWNGSAWVNDAVDLGTDTTGDYVESLVAGTGVTLSNNSGEGATPTVAIGQSVETSDSPTFAGATLDAIQVGITASNEIDTSSGNLTIDSAGGTVTVDDNLVVSGDLTVNGTTTTVNSTVTTVDDPVMTLGGDSAPGSNDSKDRGIEFRWHDGTNAKVGFFGFDESTGRFTFIPDATNTSEVFSGTLGTVDVNDIYINGTASTGTGGVVRATDPALAGTPTAPTASVGDSTTQIATTAFVDAEIGSQALLEADIAAKGDLIVGASAGTSAILSAGTDGYVLKANSSVTNGLEWVEPGSSVTISDTAPGSPSSGDLWWESDTGKLKIYYNDGDSSQWVDAFVGIDSTRNATSDQYLLAARMF